MMKSLSFLAYLADSPLITSIFTQNPELLILQGEIVPSTGLPIGMGFRVPLMVSTTYCNSAVYYQSLVLSNTRCGNGCALSVVSAEILDLYLPCILGYQSLDPRWICKFSSKSPQKS